MKIIIRSALIALALTANAGAQMSLDVAAQLQKALGKNASPEALQQGLAVATLMGCTEKQAGKPATEALYNKLQAMGKQAQGFCNAQQPGQARLMVIRAFRENQANPVVIAANDCYSKNQAAIDALAGPKVAPDIAKYVHLLHDPSTIEQEVTEQEVCRQKHG